MPDNIKFRMHWLAITTLDKTTKYTIHYKPTNVDILPEN